MSDLSNTSKFFLIVEAIINDENWKAYFKPPEVEQRRKLKAIVNNWLDKNKVLEIGNRLLELPVRIRTISWRELAEELESILKNVKDDPHSNTVRMTLVKTLLAELREFERFNANFTEFNALADHEDKPRHPRTQSNYH